MGSTALLEASKIQSIKIIPLLLANGANVNLYDNVRVINCKILCKNEISYDNY